MNFLSIDTSTNYTSVALFYNKEFLYKEENNRNHFKIISLIYDIFKKYNINLNMIDAIIYGNGPGSFTGLRISYSIVQGLSCIQNIPIFAVHSLASIAEQTVYKQNIFYKTGILTIIHSNMDKFYWCIFDKDIDLSLIGKKSRLSDIVLPNKNYESLILSGIFSIEHLKKLPNNIINMVIKKFFIYPNALSMIRLALNKSILTLQNKTICPIYID